MKIVLFHNPKAGDGIFKVSELVRQVESAGHNVIYKSIKEEDWQKVFGEPIDLAIIAGGDGSVSRAAPWLTARHLPFCILLLGTANNCAKSLDQLLDTETMVASLNHKSTKKIDLGMVISSAGQRSFIESIEIGLLPLFMNKMRVLQKLNGAKMRTNTQKRLADAKNTSAR